MALYCELWIVFYIILIQYTEWLFVSLKSEFPLWRYCLPLCHVEQPFCHNMPAAWAIFRKWQNRYCQRSNRKVPNSHTPTRGKRLLFCMIYRYITVFVAKNSFCVKVNTVLFEMHGISSRWIKMFLKRNLGSVCCPKSSICTSHFLLWGV